MTLSTYADLQTQVGNWLARDDLATYIPDFIRLFEAAACRKLKVRPQQILTTLTPVSGVVALPSDYLGYVRVTYTGSPRIDLDYISPNIFQTSYPTSPTGVPSQFTIEGANLKVGPSNDTALDFLYFQRTAAISTTLNWLYSTHPDAYLFGTLTEANAFDKAVDVAGLWKARRDEVFDEITRLDFNERQGMTMRVSGVTP